MAFYPSILPWYDQIFPFSPVQRDFVLSFGANPDWSIVDVGCGTGSLIISLAGVFRKTAGLDPDESMLSLARGKALAAGAGTWFLQAGMLDLTKEISTGSVDRLICFGNTLPHLTDEQEVVEFFRQASLILKPGGLFLIQIIDYDRIINQGLNGLPTIEDEEIRFERAYLYPDLNPSHVRFQTRLTIKETGQAIGNEVPLLALRPGILKALLQKAGFGDIEIYGNFKLGPVTPDSQPCIIKARR
jgi:cyclopropane fatty-acyl-phospholipid synthase-like methyltransferase